MAVAGICSRNSAADKINIGSAILVLIPDPATCAIAIFGHPVGSFASAMIIDSTCTRRIGNSNNKEMP